MKDSKAAQITESSTLSAADLKTLRAPFAKDALGVKVQSLSKDRTRAMLVLYLQHTDVQDRLEQVDPGWSTSVMDQERLGDTVYVRMKMTLKGVSRENVGEGGDPKSAHSDALKRCAMLFGVGRYLYDSPTVWVDYNESRDRFRAWTVQDYDRAAGIREDAPAPAEAATAAAPAPAAARPGLKVTAAKPAKRTREQLNRTLMSLYRPYLAKFPETRFVELLQERYQVGETRLMTAEQLEDLVTHLEERLRSVA
jgi:hypothetical protein